VLALNQNISAVKPSATLAINEGVKNARQAGRHIVHWGFGQSPFPVPEGIQRALIQHAGDKNYLPGAGLAALQTAVSEHYQTYYQYAYQADYVFIGPGSKELIFQLLYLIDGPLLLPAPSWVSYEPQAKLLAKPVEWLETSFEDRYLLSPKTLLQWCEQNPQVKQSVLILNSPNNPTGQQYDQQILKQLAAICRQHNIIVISDEIYAGVSFTKQAYASMAHHYPEGTIVTAGLSKLFSAGGYRLGLALIPQQMEQLKKALLVIISETFSCVTAPVQYAALEAYANYQAHLPYLQQCNKVHQLTADYIQSNLVELGVKCHPAQGAFYLMPSFKGLQTQQSFQTDQQLCMKLLEHHQLAMLPGSAFGMPAGAMCARIATVDYDGQKALLASSIEDDCFSNIRQGIEILSGFLKE
jgi:aspartate/methionine/tyrosine aminotransferase